MLSDRRDEANSRFPQCFEIVMCINTYDSLEYKVAQMNQQTIVIVLFFVLLLTDNIISLRRPAKQTDVGLQ
jgi:hypothetical protein